MAEKKKDKDAPGTDVVTSGFAALTNVNISQMMADEFAGLDISFDRIKIPSGGGQYFEIPGENPDKPEVVQEFSAVILYHHPMLVYYREKFSSGNSAAPPDCSSWDGQTGETREGGSGVMCANCPNNEFGTGEKGIGKACKARRRLYILREGELFPMLMSLPTQSLKPFSAYLMRLFGKTGRVSSDVVTTFSLKKAKSSGGIEYSQAQFGVDRILTPEEKAIIGRLSDQVKAYSRSVGFRFDDISDADAAAMKDTDDSDDDIPLF